MVEIDETPYMEEIAAYMPHYLFYRRNSRAPESLLEEFLSPTGIPAGGRATECYCTACHQRFTDTVKKPKEYKHNTDGSCPRCGAAVIVRQMDRGRKSIREFNSFAIFEGSGNYLNIRACKAELNFPDPDSLEPDIQLQTVTAYELAPGKAVQFWFTWQEGWHRKKTFPKEPCFNFGFYGYRTAYIPINHSAVDNTFLRYAFKGLSEEELPAELISWYCRLAVRPQLEYFIHGNLRQLACRYVYGQLHARLNWRSNDLKKILRLSKPELTYMQEEEGRLYDPYIAFRRDVFRGRTPEETVSYFADFRGCDLLLKTASLMTGLPVRKIMNYARRKKNNQGCYFLMTCYRDYLKECEELNYDLTNTAVTMPADLFAAHEKTAKLIRDKKDRELTMKLNEMNKTRRALEFSVPALGLMTRLPESVKEIIDEGAALDHCVAGYADRHIAGILHILFLRKISDPDKPYYTVEVRENEIQQCRGYKNNGASNPKPPTVRRFEELYQAYLDEIERKRRRKAKLKQKPKRPAPPTRYYRKKKHRAAVVSVA